MRYVLPLICNLLMTTLAWAQDDGPIAIGELQCQHLAELDGEELSFLLTWLDGYFNHMHGTATLSDQSLTNLGRMVEKVCAEPSERSVLSMLNERIRQDALSLHP